MKIELGQFARTGIEGLFGADVAAGVHAALVHFEALLRAEPAPALLLRLPPPPASACERAALEIQVEAGLERRFAQESGYEGARLPQLAAHAVLVYLADIDRAASGHTKSTRRAVTRESGDGEFETMTPGSW